MNSHIYKNIAEKKCVETDDYRFILDNLKDVFFSDLSGYMMAVQSKINDGFGEFKISMAHQPVFFPYESIVVNYLLMGFLTKKYSNHARLVTSNHIVLDMDIGDEPRFRNVRIPSYVHESGSFAIKINIEKSERHKPVIIINRKSTNMVKEYEKILNKLLMEANELRKKSEEKNHMRHEYTQLIDSLYETNHIENLSDYNRATSEIFANKINNTDTNFVDFSRILIDIHNYKGTLKDAVSLLMPSAIKVRELYSTQNMQLPKPLENFLNGEYMWGICRFCYARTTLNKFNVKFTCSKCSEKNILSFSFPFYREKEKIIPSIVPKVILEEYLILYLYGCSAYQAHSGGAEHIIISNLLYKFADLKPIPTLLWSPHAKNLAFPGELYNKYRSVSNHAKIAKTLLESGRTSWVHQVLLPSTRNYDAYWQQLFYTTDVSKRQ